MSGTVLATALALAAEGIAVFPIKYQSKEPDTYRGFYDATTNPATIKRWFGGAMKRNLAVRTGRASGIWVLDVDDPHALMALAEQHGQLPVTRQSQSSRGLHLWFKTPVIPIQSSAGRVAIAIDVKAEGGYVVAPPSVHPTGVAYRWIDDAPIAEAPSWLLVLARKPPAPKPPPPLPSAPLGLGGCSGAYGRKALEAEITILAKTPSGNRNNQLNRSAFSLFQLVAAGKLGAAEVEEALVEACMANGLVDSDGMRSVLATIRSGAGAGMQHPRSRDGGAA
jgi:hypothetical protein